MQEKGISLPTSIVSPTDIARLTREIEAVDNYFREQTIRNPGTANALPRLSKLMDQLATENQLNLLDAQHRAVLVAILEKLHASAPVLHMSFSVDPPGGYVQKIVAWLRQNIHQHALVTVGLQPNIGAGCVVRTNNRLFDFSLREFFAQKREFFIEKLHAAITEGATAEPDEPQSAPPVQQAVPAAAEPAKAAAQVPTVVQSDDPGKGSAS